jgi:hypothetical protein
VSMQDTWRASNENWVKHLTRVCHVFAIHNNTIMEGNFIVS